MANQIARNFDAIGHDKAALATADHIDKFWDPRMKADGFRILDNDPDLLGPAAKRALETLREGHDPAPQTRATEFNAVNEGGRSDAG
ncbi:MAG: formate dehydrogenase subunit delta [Novosphingobium sp.]|nr:formate dehydrogenase subunit delta [Novosphingobium sp.]